MTYEISAHLIATPEDNAFVNITDKRIKSRLLKARKIPSAFIRKSKEGYYIKSRKDKCEYLVSKNAGKWNCECHDYAMEDLKLCKHIIRCILYQQTDYQSLMNELRNNGVYLLSSCSL